MKKEHLIPELVAAISGGFSHSFQFLPNGLIRCISCLDKIYELEDLCIEVISCITSKASLYLIKTKDGLSGTAIEYWEHS